MSKKNDTTIRRGSANVFADLGFPNPDTHLLKAQLMSRVQDTLQDCRLTQTEAARITGINQPDLSRMLKGQFRDVSVERIMRMLTKLGCEVDIVVKPQGRKRAFAAIHLDPAA
ncbi:MAG: helix-turn-helix transcriptional regulator [Terriglobia bacterium]|nr:helix-turn-helix transcriptional regulator [Terriglobia bacterium]